MNLKEFIEVTSILDGRKSVIRAACITAVHDYGAEKLNFGVKPPHRVVVYDGGSIEVSETLAEICNMIWSAEI